MSLWADEAVIANTVSAGHLPGYLRYPATNRPFGYLVANGWIAGVHSSEMSLRLVSVLPSIGTLVLLAGITRWLFRSHALALAALASMAANAWSVTFAKDFKPYALEQFLVVSLLFLYLMWVRRGGAGWLVSLATVAAVSPLFSHTAVFALPWYGLLIWLDPREGGQAHRRVLFALAIALALAVAIVQYVLVGARTPADLFASTSAGYLQGVPISELPRWYARQLALLVLDFGAVGLEPPDVRTSRGAALAVVYLGGWVLAVRAFVVQRDLPALLLLVAPVFAPAVLALVFTWPFGPERLNLYLVPLVTLTVFLGWDRVLARRRSRWPALVVVAAAVVLQIPTDTAAFTSKYARFGNAQEEFRPAIERIISLEPADAAERRADSSCILFSSMSSYALNYYRFFHSTHRGVVRRLLWHHPNEVLRARDPASVESAVAHALYACPRLWIVLAHYNEDEAMATRQALTRSGVTMLWEEEFIGALLFLAQQPASRAGG